jgi:hypothetical protein
MQEHLETQPICDDPLLASYECSQSITLFPLGFPLIVESNSEEVIHSASTSWACFPQAFDEDPIVLNIGVSETGTGSLPCPPGFRSRKHLLSIISNSENFIVCDFARGYHFGWITRAVAEDSAFFRYYFMDVAVLTMVQQRYLAPVHGACIARDGRGILLCGASSAGKSTLAYACSRAGWTYVSDDATFLVRSAPGRHAIGNCHTIRFRENTRRLFPELTHLAPSLRPNGTSRIEALTHDLALTISPSCTIEHVVFLDRNQPGPARLQHSSRERALDWFSNFAFYGEDRVRSAQMDSYRKLLAADVWSLRYRELDDALTLLDRIVG